MPHQGGNARRANLRACHSARRLRCRSRLQTCRHGNSGGAAADDQDFMVRRPGHHGSPVELARRLWPRSPNTGSLYSTQCPSPSNTLTKAADFSHPHPPPRQNVACEGVGLIRLCFRGMLCRGLASWSDFVSGGTESSRTRRWKEVDSNSRSRIKRSPLQALRHAGCAASKAVMIGDRLDNDIRPARLLGWRTVRSFRGRGVFSLREIAGTNLISRWQT